MRINSGRACRLSVALALAAGALGISSAGAAAAPATTVTPTELLKSTGETITVRGSDFTAGNGVTTGIYVAQAATVGGSLKISDAAQTWVRGGDINASGEFATTLTVRSSFTSGAATVDCFVEQCQIITWREHSAPTVLFSAADIDFYVPPVVRVSQTSGLDRDGATTVAIEGTNFAPALNANGFYVAYGPNPDRYWTQDASIFGAVKWVRTGGVESGAMARLNLDGSFSTTLSIPPTYTTRPRAPATPIDVDCRYESCGIVTFAAHGGNPLRLLDTSTPVAFTPLPMTLSATPTTELNRDAPTTVTVTGTEYLTGIYAAQTAIVNGEVLSVSDPAKSKWLRRGGPADSLLSAKGAFETSVEVTPTFVAGNGQTVDCRVTQCAISAWRQHSNPRPETLYASTPVAFKAAPIVIPPPERPTPDPRSTPSIKVAAKAQGIAKNGTALIAALSCKGDAACSLTAPKTVTLKIGKKSYRLTVVAPKSLKGGKSARVYVKLPKQAIAGLTGRSAKVKVKLTLKSGATTATKTAIVTVKGRKAAKKAVKKAAQKRS